MLGVDVESNCEANWTRGIKGAIYTLVSCERLLGLVVEKEYESIELDLEKDSMVVGGRFEGE